MTEVIIYDDYGSNLSQDDLADVFHKLDLFRAGQSKETEEQVSDPNVPNRTLSGEVERWQREQLARELDMLAWERELELQRIEEHKHEENYERE